jgi:hypothetical protein
MRSKSIHVKLIGAIQQAIDLAEQLAKTHRRDWCICEVCKLDIPAFIYNANTAKSMLESSMTPLSDEEFEAVFGKVVAKRSG